MATKHKAAVEKALETGDNPAEPNNIAEDVKNVFEAMSREDEDDSLLVEDLDVPSGEGEEAPADQPTDTEDEETPAEEEAPQPSSKKGEDTQPVAHQQQAPTPPPAPTAEEARRASEDAAARKKQLAEQFEKQFSEMLTDEDRDALMTEPEKVLPRLLANASLQTLEQFRQTMGQELPQHLSRLTAEQKQAQEMEEKFFARWPQLRGADKSATVERVVRAYMSSAQQGTTPDTAIEEAGAMAMVALRIPIEEKGEAEQGKAQPSRTFTPAAPGGTTQRQVGAPPRRNAFETLAEEFLEDDAM